jgi:hypothetical protein
VLKHNSTAGKKHNIGSLAGDIDDAPIGRKSERNKIKREPGKRKPFPVVAGQIKPLRADPPGCR